MVVHLRLHGCLMYPCMRDIFHAQTSTNQDTSTNYDLGLHYHFRIGFVINLPKLSLVPSQVMFHIRALIGIARRLIFLQTLTEAIVHAAGISGSYPGLLSTPSTSDMASDVMPYPVTPLCIFHSVLCQLFRETAFI